MKEGTVWVGGCLLTILLVVALSLGGLVWSGVLRVGDTIIQREVNVQSQQYISAHNAQILGLETDYANTKDPARRQAIVNQVCLLASEIAGHVTPAGAPFVSAHCPGVTP